MQAIDQAYRQDNTDGKLCADLLVLGAGEPVVYVEIQGGNVQSVRTNIAGARLVLLDYDNLVDVEAVPTGEGTLVAAIVAAANALPEGLA